MKEKFEELLKLLQEYVTRSVNTRSEIAKICGNPNYSQRKKEVDTLKLKEELTVYAEDTLTKAESIVDAIMLEAKRQANNFDIGVLNGFMAYITACKGKVDMEVLLNQTNNIRGNMLGLKALYSTLESNEVSAPVKKVVTDLFYNLEDVENTLKNELALVFTGSASATSCGRKIQHEAYLLGVDIVSKVKDEFNDNQLLRKAAGLI